MSARLNSAVVVAVITILLGVVFKQHLLWIPISVLTAAIVDLQTRGWYNSYRVGSMAGLSTGLKFVCSLIGLYAALGQIACLVLIIWWIAT